MFNLSAPEIMNYERFMQTLKAVSDRPYDTYPISVQSVISQGDPLPFPMRKEESELFCGDKAAQALGLSYTPFMQGLTRAYQGFLHGIWRIKVCCTLRSIERSGVWYSD